MGFSASYWLISITIPQSCLLQPCCWRSLYNMLSLENISQGQDNSRSAKEAGLKNRKVRRKETCNVYIHICNALWLANTNAATPMKINSDETILNSIFNAMRQCQGQNTSMPLDCMYNPYEVHGNLWFENVYLYTSWPYTGTKIWIFFYC